MRSAHPHRADVNIPSNSSNSRVMAPLQFKVVKASHVSSQQRSTRRRQLQQRRRRLEDDDADEQTARLKRPREPVEVSSRLIAGDLTLAESYDEYIDRQKEMSHTLQVSIAPYFAQPPARWREKYASMCDDCFEKGVHCRHYPERRLRLVFIGHNPSDHAWASGHFYSNPSNNFFKLLRNSGRI